MIWKQIRSGHKDFHVFLFFHNIFCSSVFSSLGLQFQIKSKMKRENNAKIELEKNASRLCTVELIYSLCLKSSGNAVYLLKLYEFHPP